MFDAKRLLDQFTGGHGPAAGGLGRMLGGAGGSGGQGALVAGLAGLLLGSKKGRSLGGSAVKYGGLAMVGSLAYKAYQQWQASQAGGATPGAGQAGSFSQPASPSPFAPNPVASGTLAPAPLGSPFNPADEAGQQSLSRSLLRAMIAAAKADGHIDQAEQANIFAAMDKMTLAAEDKAFVMDELRAPLDVEAVARGARNAEEAAEIYTASLLAVDVDSPAERGYLQLLAARLDLDDDLVRYLHQTIEGETAPDQKRGQAA